MTSLSNHSPLHQHRQQLPQQLPPNLAAQQQQQQHHSPLHQLYQSGSSPDFEGPSPGNIDHVHHTPGSDTPGQGGDGRLDSQGNSEWGLTKAGKKRQRLPLACQVCRKKKVHFCIPILFCGEGGLIWG